MAVLGVMSYWILFAGSSGAGIIQLHSGQALK
jgi:hypothetical protein